MVDTAVHTAAHTVVHTAVQTTAHTVVHTAVQTAAHTVVYTVVHTGAYPIVRTVGQSYSSLNYIQCPVDDDIYERAKAEYYRRKNLPFFYPDRIFNMGDWLEHYNMLDVVPLVNAIHNQFDRFYEYFNVDLTQFNSLPSISLRLFI